jgi:hypothetical protein
VNDEKSQINSFGRIPVDFIEKHEIVLLLEGKDTYLAPFLIIFPPEVSWGQDHIPVLPTDCNWQFVLWRASFLLKHRAVAGLQQYTGNR